MIGKTVCAKSMIIIKLIVDEYRTSSFFQVSTEIVSIIYYWNLLFCMKSDYVCNSGTITFTQYYDKA